MEFVPEVFVYLQGYGFHSVCDVSGRMAWCGRYQIIFGCRSILWIYDLEDLAVCIYCRWNFVIVLCDKSAHPQKETAWFGWQGRETQDSFFSGYLAGVSGVCSIWIKEVAV